MQPPHQPDLAAATWLRDQRLRAGLSQRDLADRLGVTFQDLASGYEAGQRRVPPELYIAWARALGLAPKVFARTMLGFYDPITHDLLFGPPEPANDRGRDL
jgi:transcriptional regulator with XRE-family HTH domain